MKDQKCLIVSVGTGIGEDGAKSLAGAISFSIKYTSPDHVVFIVSAQSRQSTLSHVLSQIQDSYEICELADTDDINQIFGALSGKFKEMMAKYGTVTVDYTSGTKAMTGALCILAALYEVDSLSYISGERSGSIVAAGTEKAIVLRPYIIFAEKKLNEAARLFNQLQFDAVLAVLEPLESTIKAPKVVEFIRSMKTVTQAYREWDRFNHKEAVEYLRKAVSPGFQLNNEFFGKMLRASEPEPFLIADLLNNAARRGDREGKYDDAIARLYRTIELIGQYRLKKYGIEDTENVPANKIPEPLRVELTPRGGKIALALHADFRVLDAYGDNLGKKYLKDQALKGYLEVRNRSILAHGLKPVSKEVYDKLKTVIEDYAAETVPELKQLLELSRFQQWPVPVSL